MQVASFTDAWIETLLNLTFILPKEVASFTDAWIETYLNIDINVSNGRIFYRCVD